MTPSLAVSTVGGSTDISAALRSKFAIAIARTGEAADWAFWQANSDAGIAGGLRWGDA
jgi:hypothetical protein